MTPPQSTLTVITYGALGDYACMAPALAYLRQRHGPLNLVGRKELLDPFPADWFSKIEEIDSPKFRHWFTNGNKIPPDHLSFLGIIKQSLALNIQHVSIRRLYLDQSSAGPEVGLFLSREQFFQKHHHRPWDLLIHLGSSSAEHRLGTLAPRILDLVEQHGLSCRFLVGPNEPIHDLQVSKDLILSSRNLQELADCLHGTTLGFIGSDSGPLQWAATFGLETIQLITDKTRPAFQLPFIIAPGLHSSRESPQNPLQTIALGIMSR